MKIGLFGIYGVYNFGCEAIVRGSYYFLKSLYKDAEIIYYSYSSKADADILKDLDIKIVPIKIEGSYFKRGVNKLAKLIGNNNRYLLFNSNDIINSVDMLISIGGDIYTIPEVLRTQKKYPYYNYLVNFCDKAIKKGKMVVVYGASVGPWGNYQKAINYNVKALRKYKLILCREEETINYLKDCGLNNAIFFPDPAFQIRVKENKEKKYIGINLSPLSLKELYGSYNELYIDQLANLIDKLYDELKIPMMFIPHVLSNSESDNDLLFMQKIRAKMVYKEEVVFADSSSGFIGLKEYISQCYVVAAARMHCAINAIDENIPAIFLSYSQKSIGMCKYVYGNDKYLISIKEIENSLIDKIKEVIKDSEELSKKLEKRNEEIGCYYENNIDLVKQILEI